MIFADDSPILVLFCRRPRPGVGKQRVAATLGKRKALEISELLLDAALEDVRAWDGPVVIAPADAQDSAWAQRLLPDASIVPQRGDNLGERIQHVDAAIRAAGGRKVLFIGSDAPCLRPEDLMHAAEALEEHAAVLIPAADGGVILLGAAEPWPDLAELPWESPALCTALQTLCARNGLDVSLAGSGADVDTWQDLCDARDALRTDPRAARQALLRRIESEQRVSIVVPVLRDTAALSRLLARLQCLAPAPHEIIVVDGGDDAGCASVCAHFGARYLRATPCRGAQLQAGAERAGGSVLWFLHADHEPPLDAIDHISESLARGNTGGYFRFRFQGNRTWPKRALEQAINLRARVGVPYGDQGLFAGRQAFTAAGGFTAQPLFEEVRLVRGLRRQGRFAMADAAIGVSPRRWERDGWLQRTVQNRVLALGYMLGIEPGRLARLYPSGAR